MTTEMKQAQAPTVEDTVKPQNTKVQNKIVNFVEQQTQFSKSRSEFVELNKQYRELPISEKP
jgi:hypothetical protein